MASPHSPRPTRVASYALHFQIPILPMPTPPSLLKRQSSSSSTSSSSSSSTTQCAGSLADSAISSARSTPVTIPSSMMTHISPNVSRATAIPIPGTPSFRRSAPSSLCSSPVVPNTPYSTPLDSFDDLSYPAFSSARPPLLRRDTPRPAARGSLEVDEFDAHFGKGLGIEMSS